MRRQVIGAAIAAATLVYITIIDPSARAESAAIGINVLLRTSVTDAVLADLGRHGLILSVIPEIKAVLMRAPGSELSVIEKLDYVAGANPDRRRYAAQLGSEIVVSDFSRGGNVWSLDAINVTEFGVGRTVREDGNGVYVGVIDTGLVHHWRRYFPESRIASTFSRAFGGGGGDSPQISEPEKLWENDTSGHGTAVASHIIGFQYVGPEALSPTFNGVAPNATIIPIKITTNSDGHAQKLWSSVATRALVYLTHLKTGGSLGNSPLVVNMSFSGFIPDIVERAAIDYATANGVIIVAAAGNEGETGGGLGSGGGMTYPGAYPPVISVASVGWRSQFPNLFDFGWYVGNVPEGDPEQFYIAPDSSRELEGQDLDVSAPGAFVPAPSPVNGQVDYGPFYGTSSASPHVAGIAALMLQRNPTLTQSQIETILESTSMPIPPGCSEVVFPLLGPGDPPTWSDFDNVFFIPLTICWGTNATGAGLAQADAALAGTPNP